MELNFHGKRIAGILSVLPENEYHFEDEVLDPNDAKARRLKKIIGFGTRRRVKKDTGMSDMFLYGIRYLLRERKIEKEEIGALVVVTLSPDYFLPQISSILHGELDLPKEVYCLDIPQACAGFVIGLMQSFMLLEHMSDKKILLCTGEIFNRKSNETEPKLADPSFGGDVANITVIENTDKENVIYGSVFNDGSHRECLLIHDGGFKHPMTPDKIALQQSNIPFMGVSMDGSAVFNFVQKEVPPAIRSLVERAGKSMDEVDYFLFHQPNKFMLQKLAEQLGVPYAKMPMHLTEKYGNSDSGTIPTVITTEVSEQLMEANHLCCLSGFGGGLTWASLVMELGKLNFCETIVSDL